MRQLIMHNDKRIIKHPEDIRSFETAMDIQLPAELASFLLNHEGCYLDESESYFHNPDGLYEVHSVLFLRENNRSASVEAILKGHRYYGNEGYIPFAIDSGGWDYNVSIKPDTYGQIWINKFDSDEDDPFVYVAPSLEVFIDGLTSEEDN